MKGDSSIPGNENLSPGDRELQNLIRCVPYPASARDLVAPALLQKPRAFPLLAWSLRAVAVAAAGLLVAIHVVRRLPDAQPEATATSLTAGSLDAEGPELRSRLASAREQLDRIGQPPSPTWAYEERSPGTSSLGSSYPTSLTRRLDSLQSRLDALKLEFEETSEPPGPRPTTRNAPDKRCTKRRGYA
jgi:hypothetical protein